jgi:hypothetical protein
MSTEDRDEQGEQGVMQQYLDAHPCACGAKAKLTGGVLYSFPLLHEWECTCGREGRVGYTTLRRDKIEVEVTTELFGK